MKRYILTHWRGKQSLARSFLMNGVLIYLVLALGLPGLYQLMPTKAFVYVGSTVLFGWLVWAVVGIVRCAVRHIREPHPRPVLRWLMRVLAVLTLVLTALFLYGASDDVRLLLRA